MHAQEMKIATAPHSPHGLPTPQLSRQPSTSSLCGDIKQEGSQPLTRLHISLDYLNNFPLSSFDVQLRESFDDMATEYDSYDPAIESPMLSSPSVSGDDDNEYAPEDHRKTARSMPKKRRMDLRINEEAHSWKKEARSLAGDAYSDYRNRSRQRRRRCKKEAIWPDHVESAFMMAIQKVPRMGRAQVTLKGKKMGRNELISLFIYQATGEIRTRKQVSSHIQVLKKLMMHNEKFIACFDPPTQGELDTLKAGRVGLLNQWERNVWDDEQRSASTSPEIQPRLAVPPNGMAMLRHNRTVSSSSAFSLAPTESSFCSDISLSTVDTVSTIDSYYTDDFPAVYQPIPQPLAIHPSFVSIDQPSWDEYSSCGLQTPGDLHAYNDPSVTIMDSTSSDTTFFEAKFTGYEPMHVVDEDLMEYNMSYRAEAQPLPIELDPAILASQNMRTVSPGEVMFYNHLEFGYQEQESNTWGEEDMKPLKEDGLLW
ncbi:TEA-domain-containing protein [Ascodesmis nigricans]|uniref:TEA-domain-containing protein n=1 Tax=Ascodesmis nigricans TaxID=341454 RepID=A0A4V3SJC8_9PEZI|nr:TEA-domain-containing protein [Ascodesmis nigricans]